MSVKNINALLDALREALASAISNKQLDETINMLQEVSTLSEPEMVILFQQPAKNHDTILHMAAECGDPYITTYVLQTMFTHISPMHRLALFEIENKLGNTIRQLASSATCYNTHNIIDDCFIETEKELMKQLAAKRENWQDIVTQEKNNIRKISY